MCNLGPSPPNPRRKNRLNLSQKARLKLVDALTDHLHLRQDGGGPVYDKEFSKIDAHIHSFFPQSTAVWNNLPLQVRTSEDLSFFKNEIKNIDLMSIKNIVNKI